MAVRQQNGVEAFKSNAERLLAEVRRGIDHHVVAASGDQQGRTQSLIVRITGLAHAARAAERWNTHGGAGAENRDFQRSGRHGESVGSNLCAVPGQTAGRCYGRAFALAWAASGSITGCPVRGSAYAPRTMAALLPSMRTRFSKAGRRLGISAGGGAAAVLAASGGATGAFAASRLASRSSSSTTSLRNSPSAVKGRRSITRNASSCLWSLCSDKVLSSAICISYSLSRVARSRRCGALTLRICIRIWTACQSYGCAVK